MRIGIMIGLMIVSASTVAAESGAEPPKEGLVLSAMTKKILPKAKADADRMKPIFTFGKECFSKAQDLAAAKACNAGALDVAREQGLGDEFEVEDFDEWNEDVRKGVLDEIEGMLTYVACTEAARNISEYAECDDPPF